ncbi:MAG: hypothetical protein JSW59_15870 [Phycisphaerales bacterium]|nr:MAG: hypothetical protein JSW59_15870 [Phycisphaerales bacterium]
MDEDEKMAQQLHQYDLSLAPVFCCWVGKEQKLEKITIRLWDLRKRKRNNNELNTSDKQRQ